MSISDLIVVMREGVVQQIGAPQSVYDDPTNLFVAKFLGTPPINVFSARIEAGKLFIGSETVADVPTLADGNVTAAIRPEGFVPCADGNLTCALHRVEVMGRDISIVCTHPDFVGESLRAIIDSDELKSIGTDIVRFRLKPSKVYLFDASNGERIRF